MTRRSSVLLVILLIASAALAAQTALKLPQTPINVARLTAHVKEIASDAYEGRGPGTRAEQKTVDYISKQLAAVGVQPGGDADGKGGRKWTQAVELLQSNVSGTLSASIAVGGATVPLKQGDQIAVRSSLLPTSHVTIKNAPIVFVGYGVSAPERRWDDFKGLDVKGKILVVLVNDPDFEANLGNRFDGKAMTYYGRWTYKYEEAARRGAAGVLVVHETAPASYGWDVVKNSNTDTMFDIVRDKPAEMHPPLEAWIQRAVAVDLFRRAGLNFDAEKKKAQSDTFKPMPLGNATLSLDYAVKQAKISSNNVVGILKGTGHPNETLIYAAHWDHLGIGQPDTTGDRIYNGARDNADGVASVLELARVFAAAPRTDRSIVLLFVTVEERGLLGSEYYARHPLYPLETTVAAYSIDALSTAGPARDVGVAGDGKITLQDDLAAGAQKEGRRLSPDPKPEAGSFFRSDHFSFAKVGVPAISVESGLDLYAGGVAAGRKAEEDYNDKHYHQPSDEWSPSWDLRGIAIDVGLIYDLGRQLANSRRWPEWHNDSEFKALRDKTKSARK
ncbi:MAG TPA: M28 family metallopeptidase [Vicinamibacterales bacterium]|nr:M28 family metallopeptidase [Vicinamibacterales bacterium]